MVKILGDASGAAGMAAGQAIDLESVGRQLTLSELENMHSHKTGALIKASVLLPAMLIDQSNESLLARLDKYAGAVGLCFQIVDDILDVVSDRIKDAVELYCRTHLLTTIICHLRPFSHR